MARQKIDEQVRQIKAARAAGRLLALWEISYAPGSFAAACSHVLAATEGGALRVAHAVNPGVPVLSVRRANVRESILEAAIERAERRAA